MVAVYPRAETYLASAELDILYPAHACFAFILTLVQTTCGNQDPDHRLLKKLIGETQTKVQIMHYLIDISHQNWQPSSLLLTW